MSSNELSETIADYVQYVSFKSLDNTTIHETKRRIVDSIAVAEGASASEPASIVRSLVPQHPGEAFLFGGYKASAELASFYNTLLIRYLDFNDTYTSKSILHPSDLIGAVFSVASQTNASGKEIIESIATGYEVCSRLCDSVKLRSGFDSSGLLQVGIAASLSRLLGLDRKKTMSLISMALIPHISLGQSRGEDQLTMWKAGASANSSRNVTFVASLASKGFQGPTNPFSGSRGFNSLVAESTSPEGFGGFAQPRKISDTQIKNYPVQIHLQSVVEAAIEVGKSIDVGSILSVTVETHKLGLLRNADKGKWNPTNRETADHSIPFVVSAALLSGGFSENSYNLIGNHRVTDLMKRVEVLENQEYTSAFPAETPSRVIVKTQTSSTEREVRIPKGHPKRPLTDQELEQKFVSLNAPIGLLESIWSLEQVSVGDLIAKYKK